MGGKKRPVGRPVGTKLSKADRATLSKNKKEWWANWREERDQAQKDREENETLEGKLSALARETGTILKVIKKINDEARANQADILARVRAVAPEQEFVVKNLINNGQFANVLLDINPADLVAKLCEQGERYVGLCDRMTMVEEREKQRDLLAEQIATEEKELDRRLPIATKLRQEGSLHFRPTRSKLREVAPPDGADDDEVFIETKKESKERRKKFFDELGAGAKEARRR